MAADLAATPTIMDYPPLIYHLSGKRQKDVFLRARDALARYRKSLEAARRVLLDRDDVKDLAFKVVGIDNVGIFCTITLLVASKKDPLFLQVKEARGIRVA